MTQEFDVGVYNLNYDTVALNALPGHSVGFNRERGDFQSAEVHKRRRWKFLYHLHGSVHHRIVAGSQDMSDPDFGVKLVWHEDLSQKGDREDWEDVKDLMTATDGKRILPTSLITGGWKLDQLQEEPFLSFYSALPRHAHEADAFLIGGYGFGDPHVYSVLNHALRARSPGSAPAPVLILDFVPGRTTTAKRHDVWTTSMARTLRTSPQDFRARPLCHVAQWTDLPDSVPEEMFEQSLKRPIAIWNAGFLAGAKRSESIVRWLCGDTASL